MDKAKKIREIKLRRIIFLGLTILLYANLVSAKGIYVTLDGVRYSIEDNAASICGFTEPQTELVIPSSIIVDGDEIPVTGIKNLPGLGNELGDVVIPLTIKTIKEKPFANKKIENLYFEGSLDSLFIESDSFDQCNVKNLYIESLEGWCGIEFDYDVFFQHTGVYLSSSANPINKDTKLYVNGELVTDLRIPNNVEQISPFAFNNLSCDDVIIGDGVKFIGAYAFQLSDLKSLTLGKNLVDIGQSAFSYCRSLKNITITSENEEGLTIGYNAFYCNNIENLYAPSLVSWLNVESIYTSVLGVTSSMKFGESYNIYIGGELLKNVVIPGNASIIYPYSFAGSSITSVEIEEGVEDIGGFAFAYCLSLNKMILPSSLKRIEYSCINLDKNIKSLEIKSLTPPEIYSFLTLENMGDVRDPLYVSSIYNTCELIVPEDALNTYKKTYPWSEFETIIPAKGTADIDDIANNDHTEDVIYDLQGRRYDSFENLSPGVYVINGKKIMK